MLVEKGRLELSMPPNEWVDAALNLPNVVVIPLSPQIATASSDLPPSLHRDPADRILVATARSMAIPFLTADQRLIDYPHVVTL